MSVVEDVNVMEMTHKMRLKPTDAPSTIVSKKLSYILRYGVNRNIDLPKDAEGYFAIKDILALSIFSGVTEEQVFEVIDASNNEKARYDIAGDAKDRRVKAAGHRAEAGERKEAKREERKKKKELTARYVEEKLRLGGVEGFPNNIGFHTGNESMYTSPISAQQKNYMDSITLPKHSDSEKEFITKWDLNEEAQKTLAELPVFQRYAVIQEFSPNPEIVKENYSKVFINFCRRFKAKVAKMEDGILKGEKGEPKALNSAADPFVPSVSPYTSAAWNPYAAPMWGMPPAMFMPPPPPHMLKGLKGKGKGKQPAFDFFGAYNGTNAGLAAAMAGQQFAQMYNQAGAKGGKDANNSLSTWGNWNNWYNTDGTENNNNKGKGKGKGKKNDEKKNKDDKDNKSADKKKGKGGKKDEKKNEAGEGKKNDEKKNEAGKGGKKNEKKNEAGKGAKKDEKKNEAGKGAKKDEKKSETSKEAKKDEKKSDSGKEAKEDEKTEEKDNKSEKKNKTEKRNSKKSKESKKSIKTEEKDAKKDDVPKEKKGDSVKDDEENTRPSVDSCIHMDSKPSTPKKKKNQKKIDESPKDKKEQGVEKRNEMEIIEKIAAIAS